MTKSKRFIDYGGGAVLSETIAVWFSCGAASAVAAYKTLENYPNANVRVLNNPVAEEDEDNRRFLRDVERWIRHPIETVTHPDWPSASAVEVWDKRKYMSGVAGAPCTGILKKQARQLWESENHWDRIVLGFTVDEQKRSDQFAKASPELLPVLINEGMTKQDCYDFLLSHGIEPPRVYRMGFPNANCVGCVKATSPTYWNHVRLHFPDVFNHRANQSREIGARLVRHNGKRIFLDELPSDAKGQKLKSMAIECGTFCEALTGENGENDD